MSNSITAQSFERPTCTVGQVYPELLKALCTLLNRALEGNQASACWYGTFYRWFQQDIVLWETERNTLHHLQAFGGMGSFNDCVPTVDFPGGSAGFEHFYQVYRLLKELSYASAELWYEARQRYSKQPNQNVLINYRGIPVTICTCTQGHRWMKEDLALSFYSSHANTIAEMNAGFECVAKYGGDAAVDWLFQHTLSFNSAPVLNAMRTAIARSGLGIKQDDCKACSKKRINSEIRYLIGWPMTLSPEFFRVELTCCEDVMTSPIIK